MFKQSKSAIRKLFTDSCTIINFIQKENVYGSTIIEKVVVCENEPCRLSYSSFKPTKSTEHCASELEQEIKLFIREDLEIVAGSKIIITRNGITTEYDASGQPAIHTNHQEINLNLVGRYA
jgi:hypothetical protein